ncbi:hypothetical protein J7K93_04540 [bacterium]|nr:hypothetical protein [bacterium]
MGKKNRHFFIQKLLDTVAIGSQQEFLTELRKEGIKISQSTLSKDLKELGIIKVRGKNGRFKFLQTRERDSFRTGVLLKREVLDYLQETTVVNNLLVMKTILGNAAGLSRCLDDINWPEIVATIAGVDTLVVITKSDEDAQLIDKKIHELTIQESDI